MEMDTTPNRGNRVNGSDGLDGEQTGDVWFALSHVHDGQSEANREGDHGRRQANELERLAIHRRLWSKHLASVRTVNITHEHGGERKQSRVCGRDHRSERGEDEKRSSKVTKRRSILQLESELSKDALLNGGTRRVVSQGINRGPSGNHRRELHPEEGKVHSRQSTLKHFPVLCDEEAHGEMRKHRRGGSHSKSE